MDTRTKLSKARTQLLLEKRYIFWATIGMYQQLIEDKNVPTMGTDGEHLYYNPDFVDSLSLPELMFVLAHEAGHCALGHHLRRQERELFRWNIACDYALNQILVDCGGLTPPKSILLDKKYQGMSSEEIYNKVKVTYIKITDWNCGGVMDGKRGDKENEAKWEMVVKQAAQAAKSQGHLPGQFEHLLEPITPKLDLHSMLRHLISTVRENDYSWARPNKKYVHQGVYLPSLRSESVGDVLVGVDVSGSVSNEDVAKFIGVVNVVIADLKPRVVYLVQCDADIQTHEEYHSGEPLPTEVKVKGRGGTDMNPIWKWAKDKTLTCAIVCSDFMMDAASFGPVQAFPVLWVTCTKDVKAPWGQTARLDE